MKPWVHFFWWNKDQLKFICEILDAVGPLGKILNFFVFSWLLTLHNFWTFQLYSRCLSQFFFATIWIMLLASNIFREVMKIYNLGDNSFETDFTYYWVNCFASGDLTLAFGERLTNHKHSKAQLSPDIFHNDWWFSVAINSFCSQNLTSENVVEFISFH